MRRSPRPTRPRSPRTKLVTLPILARRLAAARRRRARVVLTNGVFDLLHVGHASLLARARALGDLLVVAVNTDASVRRLKGPDRPFVRGKDRFMMLAALEAVDYVVPFAQDTPAAVIRRARPDVLVKGGDWAATAIAGREFVESYGGRVVRLALVKGLSTTDLARRIRSRRRR